jgi:hypothetical protein
VDIELLLNKQRNKQINKSNPLSTYISHFGLSEVEHVMHVMHVCLNEKILPYLEYQSYNQPHKGIGQYPSTHALMQYAEQSHDPTATVHQQQGCLTCAHM